MAASLTHSGSHSGWLRRLADELDDDGIALPADVEFCHLLLEELDHCRRVPMFEGRRPTYGAIIFPYGPDIAPSAPRSPGSITTWSGST